MHVCETPGFESNFREQRNRDPISQLFPPCRHTAPDRRGVRSGEGLAAHSRSQERTGDTRGPGEEKTPTTLGVLIPSRSSTRVFCAPPTPPPDARDPRISSAAALLLRPPRPRLTMPFPAGPLARHNTFCRTPATPPSLPSITRAVFAGALPARAVPTGLPPSEKLDKGRFHRVGHTISTG